MLTAKFDGGECVQAVEQEPCLYVAGFVPSMLSTVTWQKMETTGGLQSIDVSCVSPIVFRDPSQRKVIQAVIPVV